MEEIKRFNKDVKEDKEMLDKVKSIGNNLEKIVEYANSKGYDFTIEDLESEVDNNSELSEEQLDEVSGGKTTNSLKFDNGQLEIFKFVI
ncbi:MAG: Nif11-like leader peptide family RiPP precursor [Bacillota bacterium]